MKKIILVIFGMVMALTYVSAQTDSTNNSAPLQSPGQQPNQYRKQDRIAVKSSELPASIKQTLTGNDDYAGWEKSTIYRDRSTNTYFFKLSNRGATKTYYFDQNGQAVTGAERTSPSDNSSGDPNKP